MSPLATSLPGMVVLEPQVRRDARGFFVETYRAERLAELGVEVDWVQDNHSRSTRGVLRGMHFSVGPGQAKLVRCARGAILDVAVDIRRGSPTYARWDAVRLDDVDMRSVYLPVGFAHGFVVVSDVADVVYKCSSYYDPDLERTFAWDDPDVAVRWPELDVEVSERDAAAPRLREIASELPFTYSLERSSTASQSRT
jgi:dTDP-4-dehydrorhamnose 3,5-epimerase